MFLFPQVTPDKRRSSDGDIFLRCKPRSAPPPVAPKLRRVSLEHPTLPTVPERSTGLSSVLESTVTATATCQATSNLAPFTSDVTDGFSPAIFSPTPQQQHSPLDDIITALEKICVEFTGLDCRTDPDGGRRDQRVSSKYNNNNDDVFDEKPPSGRPQQEFFNEGFNYVNPTFEDLEPVLYRSTFQFTPRSGPERREVASGLSKVSAELSEVSSGLSKVSAELPPYFQSRGTCRTPTSPRNNGESSKEQKVKKSGVPSNLDLPKSLASSSGRNPDRKGSNGTRRDSSPSEELEIVKNILAKLDFQKYKRRLSLDTDRKASAMEEKSPKPPRHNKPSSSEKFKDLFHILKPNAESSSSKKTQFALSRSLSFSNAEENIYTENEELDNKSSDNPNKLFTLPRRFPTSQPTKVNILFLFNVVRIFFFYEHFLPLCVYFYCAIEYAYY